MIAKFTNLILLLTWIVLSSMLTSSVSASPLLSAPGNDNITNAVEIMGQSNGVMDNNEGATKEWWEGDWAGNRGGASVWFRWIAPAEGQVTFDPKGSNLDTLLAIYTLPNTSMSPVQLDSKRNSPISFDAVAGTEYYIGVDGYNGATGRFLIIWAMADLTFSLSGSNSSVPEGDLAEIDPRFPAGGSVPSLGCREPGAKLATWSGAFFSLPQYYADLGVDVCVPASFTVSARLVRPDQSVIPLQTETLGTNSRPSYYRATYLPTIADPPGTYTFLVDGVTSERTTLQASIVLSLPSKASLIHLVDERAIQLFGFKPGEVVRLLVYEGDHFGSYTLSGWNRYVVDAKGQLYLRIDPQLYTGGKSPRFIARGDVSGEVHDMKVGDLIPWTTGGQTALFFDDLSGPNLLPFYEASLPNAIFRPGSDNAAYQGGAGYAFESLEGNSVARFSNNLRDTQRRGWSTSRSFTSSDARTIRLEVRLNTLVQSRTTAIDQLLEVWLIDAINLKRYDKATLFSYNYGGNRMFSGDSSISGRAVEQPLSFRDNSWYRIVLTGSPTQTVRASLYADDGTTELARVDLRHTLSDYASGVKIGISQSMGHPNGVFPTQVAIDWLRLSYEDTASGTPTVDFALTDLYTDNQPNGRVFARISNNSPTTVTNLGMKLVCRAQPRPRPGVAALGNSINVDRAIFINSKPGQVNEYDTGIQVNTNDFTYSVTCSISGSFNDPQLFNNTFSEDIPSPTPTAPQPIPSPTWTVPPPTNAPPPTYAPATVVSPPPNAPPGVYVTSIRVDPPQPKEKQDVWFYVTFLNTTSSEQRIRWFVFVYRAEQKNPFGQTSYDRRGDGQDFIPVGSSERKTLNTWKVTGDGACKDYWAKANWFDPETGAKPEFTDPNNGEYLKSFTVCPP